MRKAHWIIPSISPERGDACVGSLRVGSHYRVRNYPPHRNRGVAASWNIGAEQAARMGAVYLVVCSEAMLFGPAGGQDFEDQLSGPWCDSTFGWHLVAFATAVLAEVGPFDEGFPAYYEDTDYLYRLHLAGYPSPRENDLPHTVIGGVDAADRGTALAVREGLVRPDWEQLDARYRAKWGGAQGDEVHTTPWGRPT